MKIKTTLEVEGLATFFVTPVGPASNPTTDNQLARKAYVDSIITSTSSIDPGHKHSKLWASDGSPEALTADVNGALTTLYTITASRFALDANAYFTISNSNPVLNFDANDYIMYNRSTNLMSFVVGASTKLYVDSYGIRIPNNTKIQFPDTLGYNPYFICQSDNNVAFYNTNASGATYPVWSHQSRQTNAPFVFYVRLKILPLPPYYADNNAAKAAGKTAGDVYRMGGDPDYLCTVY